MGIINVLWKKYLSRKYLGGPYRLYQSRKKFSDANSCKADAWKEMIGPKLTPLYVFSYFNVEGL